MESIVDLRYPTVRDFLNAVSASDSKAVFSHDETLRWVAPNVLFEIAITDLYGDTAKVVNVVLVFSAGYFWHRQGRAS